MIYICSNCLRATCWLGFFMCDGSRGAGLYRARRSDLRKLDLENEDYWNEPSVIAPRHDTKTPMLPRSRKAPLTSEVILAMAEAVKAGGGM